MCYNIISESNKTVELTWEAIGKGYEGDILVPNTVSYNSTVYNVIGIGRCAFVKVKELNNNGECYNWDSNNSLTKVVLSSGISYISDYSFDGCMALLNVVFPSKLTSIGMQSFCGCDNLSDIDLSTTKTVSIGEMSFSYCSSLEKISLPRTLKTIGMYAFVNSTNLKTIQLEVSNPYLCLKDNVVFSKDMNSLIMCVPGKHGEYVIPEGVSTIEDTAFSGCEYLTKVVLPQTLIYIGTDAFCYCRGLYEISLPDGLKELKYGAFRDCSYKSVTLPNSLISIGSEAFSSETLEKVVSNIVNPYPIDKYVFGSNYNKIAIYVPQGTLSKYQQTEGWNLFENIEEITSATYTLSIKATGNGSVSYDGNTIRSRTSTFTVNGGASATITFSPDNGYRIRSVKINNTNVTSDVYNNQYTISITANATMEVEFEAIPPSTYTLFITATGNGTVTYSYSTIRNNTYSYTLNEGESVTISISSDSGYRIKRVKEDGSDVTAYVSNGKFTISSINKDTYLGVEFEAIPVTAYSLNITATGNGYASYDGTAVRNGTTSFTVDEGTNATITFSPDNGNNIASVKVNNNDVTSKVSGNRYAINNITANTTLAVMFQEDVNVLTEDGVNYTVVSQADRTVKVIGGDFGQVLNVPATVTQNGKTWIVIGIDTNALKDNTELAAVIWNPTYDFMATVSNPNLLLYVKAECYAPSAIQNVVVNGTANSIVLTEAQGGNNFYCPQTFTARRISFTHNYKMTTGIGESRGWETIALPFDVQTITHATKGEIVPFANWTSGSTKKPFWLYQLTGSGFKETDAIKAYTPYIISMPNNSRYGSEWLLNGSVTFSATNITIHTTDNVQTATYSSRTFVPNYADRGANEGLYALNAVNDYVTNNSGMTEGSKFVLNMRQVHPFEAYMTSSLNARTYFDIFDDLSTDIKEEFIVHSSQFLADDRVFDLQGRKVEHPSKKGVYIINGKKMVVK